MTLTTGTRPASPPSSTAARRDDIRAITRPEPGTAAATLEPLLELLVGLDGVVRVECWDGSAAGPLDPAGTIYLTPAVLRRMLWSPDELGIARAFVSGEMVFDGDLFAALAQFRTTAPRDLRLARRVATHVARAARLEGVV